MRDFYIFPKLKKHGGLKERVRGRVRRGGEEERGSVKERKRSGQCAIYIINKRKPGI